MGQPQMGGGTMNEPHPRSQHFGETRLKPEELCDQSGGSMVATAMARAGSNPCHRQEGK